MGKNQTYKAMQRAKAMSHAPSAGGPEEEGRSADGMVDGTFHSPEWHAARLASLQTSHTLTWEEWKAQRKEEARKEEEAHGFEEKRMREYRDQLDREREEKLARGRNHASKRDKLKKKEKKKDKSKSKKSKKDKKRKHDSDSSSSDSEDVEKQRKDKKKKKKSAKQSDGDLSSASEEDKGPVRLSSFFHGNGGELSSDGEDRKPGSKPGTKEESIKAIMDEAKRRAEIGAHMVAEVKKADELRARVR